MASISNAQGNFLGGFWSPEAHGRFDDPNYKLALAECLNAYPVEEGAWIRRPGWRCIGYTHRGRPAKVLPLAGEETVQYNIELTEGFLRIANGMSLLTDGNLKNVTNVSTDNPVIITTDVPHEWATGDTVALSFQSKTSQYNLALLSNRLSTIEVIDGTNFKLHDYITGAGINGALCTWDATYIVSIAKVLVLGTPYTNSKWASVRHVQTDTNTLLLHPNVAPQLLTMVEAGPTSMQQTSLRAAQFVDGPYYDAVNGSIATPDGLSGIINVTFSFAVWSSTNVYGSGDIASYNGIYFISTADANINNAPSATSAFWTTTAPTGFVNQGLGFLPSDVGRHIRFFSEPPDWVTGTTYAVGNLVRFNINGNTTYWSALKAMAGATPTAGSVNPNQPGLDPTTWVANASAALWTWGKIVSNNAGNKVPFVGTDFGNLTDQGGLTTILNATLLDENAASKHNGKTGYVGYHFTTPTKLSSARLYPAARANGAGNPNPSGGVGILGTGNNSGSQAYGTAQSYPVTKPQGGLNSGNTDYTFAKSIQANVRISLYGSQSPITGTNGTLLGQVTLSAAQVLAGGALISSNDNTTSWAYASFYIEVFPVQNTATHIQTNSAAYAQPKIVASYMEFYDDTQHAGSKIAVQIYGVPLLFASAIRTWRVGRFNSSEPNWPHTGCYHGGRIFLASGTGHFDAGKAGGGLIFSPTYPDGSVADDSAIGFDFASTVKAKILWMNAGEDGVTCGTPAGEFLISAPSAKNSLSPNDIDGNLVTEFGAANVEPARAPHALLFVHQNTHDVQEYMRDLYSGKLVASLLTARSHSLSTGGITQVAFQKSKDSILWATTGRGALIGTTYRRDTRLAFSPPTYNGWHRHNHGAGRLFLSVSVAPSRKNGLDVPLVVTLSPGTGLCRLEVQGDTLDTDATIFDCAFLDGQMVQISGLMGGAPGTGEAPPPPPPPPPPPQGWVLAGWHLVTQCPAENLGGGPTGLTGSPVVSESLTYLTPPTSMTNGDPCGFGGFAGGTTTVPGYTPGSFPPSGATFTIAQYTGTFFGATGWRPYQHWAADTPGSPAPIGSGPVYNP